MNVEGANKHARSLVGTSATISVSATTKIVRDDVEGALSDLQAGDALNVQIRACKGADLATTALVAKRVSAESPVSEEPAADPVVEPAP